MPGRRAIALLLMTAGGCHGCRDDHPYVPYSIDSRQPAVSVSDDAGTPAIAPQSPDDRDTDPFSGQPSTMAPPELTRWVLDGVALEAPAGFVFALGVVRDFDGDGAPDAFAIVRPQEPNDPGKVVFFRGPAPPGGALVAAETFSPPAGLARDPSCTPVDRLVVVGRRSVLAELGAACPLHASNAPARWVAVVVAGPPPKVWLAMTISDPPGAPALSIDAGVNDRDRDGLDDIAVRVSIEGGGAPLEPGPRVSATLAWLDRSAGLSRDTAATESSFAALAASAASRATRAREAPAVPGYVAQLRALWRATCSEGSSPRIVGVVGTGAIACGAARALGDAGLAEVRAYATMGDPLRAALALDRSGRPPAKQAASSVPDAQRWIAQLAPIRTARAVRAIAAVPAVVRGHEPSWGVLAFEPGGKLLVRTAAGVARVDPDGGDEAAADGVDWRPGVTSPDNTARWIEAYDPCDGLPLRATFTTGGGDDVRDVALPVAPPLGGRCVGSRGAPARAIPVAWGAGGLEAIVEGEPVLIAPNLERASLLASFLDQPSARGSPRSPDGKTYVVPTGAGLIVRGPARARLLRAPEIDGTYAELRDCVVSDDATHVACVRGAKAWVGTWDAP